MNERIQTLAEQAGIQQDLVDHLKDEVEVLTYIARPQDIEQFVRLIAQECAELFGGNEQSELGYHIGDRIYKHFGIK